MTDAAASVPVSTRSRRRTSAPATRSNSKVKNNDRIRTQVGKVSRRKINKKSPRTSVRQSVRTAHSYHNQSTASPKHPVDSSVPGNKTTVRGSVSQSAGTKEILEEGTVSSASSVPENNGTDDEAGDKLNSHVHYPEREPEQSILYQESVVPTCTPSNTDDEIADDGHEMPSTIVRSSRVTSRKRPAGATTIPPSKKQHIAQDNGVFLQKLNDLKSRIEEQAKEIRRLKAENELLLNTNNDLKTALHKPKIETEAEREASQKANMASLADAVEKHKKQVVQLQYQLTFLNDPSSKSM